MTARETAAKNLEHGMRYYWDSVHFKNEVGTQLTQDARGRVP
jgi:hypothetical protein